MMLGRWAAIILLSMTPALVAGQSFACAAGIAWNIDAWVLLPVVAASSFVEGAIVAFLAGKTGEIRFIAKLADRVRTPRAMSMVERWGAWGGLTLGVAIVGQEPVLVALRWLGVDMKKIWLPLAVSNAIFAVIWYALVKLGYLAIVLPSWDLFKSM